MAEVRITPTVDGPYMVTGDIELVWPSGHNIPADKELYLCRCGQSGTKPICDMSHVRVGFKSVEGDATAR
jgi:CDGSH-type Zn-finger protein